jgi:hypothetical protein
VFYQSETTRVGTLLLFSFSCVRIGSLQESYISASLPICHARKMEQQRLDRYCPLKISYATDAFAYLEIQDN